MFTNQPGSSTATTLQPATSGIAGPHQAAGLTTTSSAPPAAAAIGAGHQGQALTATYTAAPGTSYQQPIGSTVTAGGQSATATSATPQDIQSTKTPGAGSQPPATQFTDASVIEAEREMKGRNCWQLIFVEYLTLYFSRTFH